MSQGPPSHTGHFFYRLLYTRGTFNGATKFSGALGREGCGAVSRLLTLFYTRTQPHVVEVVRKNLCLLKEGGASTGDARITFENFALGLADYFAFGSMSLREACSYCEERHGLEHLREAAAEGRGAILATGHFGLFEFGSALLAELGYSSTVLTFPEPSAEFTRWRADYRARWGAQTIEIGRDAFSSLAVVQELQRGKFCAMLVDRPFGGPSVPVELPGGTALFSLSPGILAHLAGCPVIPVIVRRKPDGTYFLRAGALIRPDATLPKRESIVEVARRTGAALAQEFVADPRSWFHFVPVEQKAGPGPLA
jgi:lauroyl/myristoyl acyltransferase